MTALINHVPDKDEDHRTIIFFDGHCALCQSSVRYLYERIKDPKVYFAPLTGSTASSYLDQSFLDAESIVLLRDGHASKKTQAVISIVLLILGWRCIAFVNIIPWWIFDPIYNIVAKYRYIFFGRNQCEIVQNSRLLP